MYDRTGRKQNSSKFILHASADELDLHSVHRYASLMPDIHLANISKKYIPVCELKRTNTETKISPIKQFRLSGDAS